jgi:hypothetical protein
MKKEAHNVALLLGDEVSKDRDSGWRWLAVELQQLTALSVLSSNGRRGRCLRPCAKNGGVRRQAKSVSKKKDGGGLLTGGVDEPVGMQVERGTGVGTGWAVEED